jgi:hypothetical protein
MRPAGGQDEEVGGLLKGSLVATAVEDACPTIREQERI